MAMPVVDVRVVRVRMTHRTVVMGMAVRFAGRVVRPMFMLMVLVVDVAMVVVHLLMLMFVSTSLRQVQPDPETHEAGGQEESDRGTIIEEQKRDRRPDKRSYREVRTRAGGAEAP